VRACPPGGVQAGAWDATGLTCPMPRFEGDAVRTLVGGTFPGIEIGGNSSTASNVTMRGVKLQGPSATTFGLFMRGPARNIVFEDGEITGFDFGVHIPVEASSGFVLRNTRIHRNAKMGFLGASPGMLLTGNAFEANNTSGSNYNHAIYIGSMGMNATDMRVVGNTFIDNSVVNGVCTGGNLTAHGQITGLVIEGNTIRVPAATGACYGISLVPGYATAEWFRRTVVRGNTIERVGIPIAAAAAPGILVENNVTSGGAFDMAILIPEREGGPGDDADGGAIVRNNRACGVQRVVRPAAAIATDVGNILTATCP
jgi:hypothetical protein